MNQLRAVSLFSGAGGFEQGFDRAGVRTVLQAENDPWCLEVLARHWPEVDRVDDVREVDARSLGGRGRHMAGAIVGSDAESTRPRQRGDADTGADLVYGGFPCQDVSVAGKRAGLRGDRSGLFYEFARVVRDLRPRWFAAENVPGLLSSPPDAPGVDFGIVLRTMVELGYGVAWRVLDGRWFGVPQRRRRPLIVGCLGDPHRAAQVLAVCESCGGHPAPRGETREAVAASLRSRSSSAGVHMPGRGGEDDDNLIAYTLPASNRGTGDGHGNAWNSNYVAGTISGHHGNVRADQAWTGQLVPTLSPGAHPGGLTGREGENGALVIAQTLSSSYGKTTASGGSHGSQAPVNVIHGAMGVRRLTPRECERLMAWPDEWTRWTADGREIADSHRYRMCGNGVIATVAEWLGHRLVQAERFRVAA